MIRTGHRESNFIAMCLVDVGAVDTFRPRGQMARRLTNDQFVSSTVPPLQEGASGEIADPKSSILPITPVSVAPC